MPNLERVFNALRAAIFDQMTLRDYSFLREIIVMVANP